MCLKKPLRSFRCQIQCHYIENQATPIIISPRGLQEARDRPELRGGQREQDRCLRGRQAQVLQYYSKGNIVVETVVQIGLFALARREEKIHGNEEACAGRNILFLALQFTNLPDVQWAEDEGPGGDQVQDVDVESPELQDPVDHQGSHPGFRLRHCRY